MTDHPEGLAARVGEIVGSAIRPDVPVDLGGLRFVIAAMGVARSTDRGALVILEPPPEPVIRVPLDTTLAWATVDTERAERDLLAAGIVEGPSLPAESIGPLGADARAFRATVFGVRILLIEPNTEGRLAATLAVHGEGPSAVILGERSSGPPVLDPIGLPTGPHLLVHGAGYHPGP